MNKQLIDRDNVLQGIEEIKKSPFANPQDGYAKHLIQETLDIVSCLCVKKEPTVDAAEVVRCSKCKYWYPIRDVDKDGNTIMEYDNGLCKRDPRYFCMDNDDYCSKGERKEDDDKNDKK